MSLNVARRDLSEQRKIPGVDASQPWTELEATRVYRLHFANTNLRERTIRAKTNALSLVAEDGCDLIRSQAFLSFAQAFEQRIAVGVVARGLRVERQNRH